MSSRPPVPTPRGPRRVALVIEDDLKTATWLRLYLDRAGFDTVHCGDGRQAAAAAAEAAPDVVLLDLMLPGTSGFEICRELRAGSSVPIIVITARSAEADRLRGFECGADDYVTKPFSPREVIARVTAVTRRLLADRERPLQWGGWSLDTSVNEVRSARGVVRLTAVEARLLAAFLRAPGRVFSRSELVVRMFGDDYRGSDRAVDVHVKNLRKKLDGAPAAASIQTIHGAGYRLTHAPA